MKCQCTCSYTCPTCRCERYLVEPESSAHCVVFAANADEAARKWYTQHPSLLHTRINVSTVGARTYYQGSLVVSRGN